jgi:hypothetical protein
VEGDPWLMSENSDSQLENIVIDGGGKVEIVYQKMGSVTRKNPQTSNKLLY